MGRVGPPKLPPRSPTPSIRSLSPLISIHKGTFFREHPSSVPDLQRNPALFPGLNFQLPLLESDNGSSNWPPRAKEHWAVISAKGGTSLLEILRGSHFCEPLKARQYPYLTSGEVPETHRAFRIPSQAVQYVGFNPAAGNTLGAGIQGAYLSARYESRRLTAEETDWTVRQYLKGQTTLNPSEEDQKSVVDDAAIQKVVSDLRLHKLLDMPVSNLSNGQTRRSRIAKALLKKPLLLLLDDPFMGLDPPTLVKLSPILRDLAFASSPLLLLALRAQDPIPDWITHLAMLGENHTIASMGPKETVLLVHQAWLDKQGKSKRVNATASADRSSEVAQELSRRHGPPLQGLSETLTAHGVIPYRAYHQLKEAEQSISLELSEDQPIPSLEAKNGKSQADLDEVLNTLASPSPPNKSSGGGNPAGASALPDQDAETSQSVEVKKSDLGPALIELQSVVVKYGDRVVLGHPPAQVGHDTPGLNIDINEGTRLALIGPNGSGKTTFLSLLTSDHPQSYSLPIKFFGRSRLPEAGKPGLSLWEIQSRIGHSAPEVHSFFPKSLSVRQVLESAWAETYVSRPRMTHARDKLVDAFLRWWEPELRQDRVVPENTTKTKRRRSLSARGFVGIRQLTESTYPPVIKDLSTRWAEPLEDAQDTENPERPENLDWAENTSTHRFGVLPFGTQRLLLLLRAVIKEPDILILDEAFSGLSAPVRDKAMCFLEYGETKFLMNMPELAVVKNDMYDVSAKDSVLCANRRIDVNRLLHVENQTLGEIIDRWRRSKRSPEFRDKTAQELIEKSQRLADENANNASWNDQSDLHDFCFRGLTKRQALVVVSHVKEEVPEMCDEFVRLPGEEEVVEDGRPIEMGYVGRGGISRRWHWLWQPRTG